VHTGFGIAVVHVRATPLAPRVTDAERAAHRAFVAALGDKAIWKDYLPAA
jgi:DNA polymerase-3 subunit epsilon